MLTRYPAFLVLLLLCSTALSSSTFAEEPAPDFKLLTFPDDSSISLKDLKGRVVYLDFWATWCPPCRKSFPWMDEMHERYSDEGLTIIAVSIDKKRELIERFVGKMDPAFIVAHDPRGKVAKTYKLRAMPTSYLIDRDGQLTKTHMGFRNKDKKRLESTIQSLLEK